MDGIWKALNSYNDKIPSQLKANIANVISVVSIPLIACIPFILVLCTSACKNDAPLIGLVAILCNSILPCILLVIYSWRTGMDLDFPDRKDRTRPVLICIACYLLGSVVLYAMNAPNIIVATSVGYLVSTVLILLISLKWKISIHASGISGPVIFIMYQFGDIYALLFLLCLLVWWARYTLGKHTILQLIAGSTMSAVICYATLLLMV